MKLLALTGWTAALAATAAVVVLAERRPALPSPNKTDHELICSQRGESIPAGTSRNACLLAFLWAVNCTALVYSTHLCRCFLWDLAA